MSPSAKAYQKKSEAQTPKPAAAPSPFSHFLFLIYTRNIERAIIHNKNADNRSASIYLP
jgi:hypothetical protein